MASFIVRQLARRPGCVCACTLGLAFALLGTFAVGVAFKFLPLSVSFSADQLQISGDPIADRHRALR